jgi:hypothetical protein
MMDSGDGGVDGDGDDGDDIFVLFLLHKSGTVSVTMAKRNGRCNRKHQRQRTEQRNKFDNGQTKHACVSEKEKCQLHNKELRKTPATKIRRQHLRQRISKHTCGSEFKNVLVWRNKKQKQLRQQNKESNSGAETNKEYACDKEIVIWKR